jgi:glycosyltransferase XagB
MASHQFLFRAESPVLPPAGRVVPPATPSALQPPLGVTLLRDGAVAPDMLIAALRARQHCRTPLANNLVASGAMSPQALTAHRARSFGIGAIDPRTAPPDRQLVAKLGAADCLAQSILPWGHMGSAVVILASDRETFERHRLRLEQTFGKVVPALAAREAIEAAILALSGPLLDHQARHRVPENASCRDLMKNGARLSAVAILFSVALAASVYPQVLLLVVTLWAILTLIAATLLKTAATIAALTRQAVERAPPVIADLPVVSVMVPLFNEARIARRLLERLQRIDYPQDRLDIHLVVEEDDQITRAALSRTALPENFNVTVAPQSTLKTKPRALNHALRCCRGSIVAIYDAEDAPAPDQLRHVADMFHLHGPEVACLQGILDYSNPRTNWLSRCFTIEYATWFRIMLPGMARLGLAIPLGGTTLFFRKAALEAVGGWDAHNVTEDADLGMRLARAGFRTELLHSLTMEEANCRVLPWIRQRSRWIKGYMMTYAVHMRDPCQLWRELGWWRFVGFQILFLSTLSQFLLTPLILSFWLVALGLPHPATAQLPDMVNTAILAGFVFSEAVLLVVGVIAMRLTMHRMNPLWALAQHVYFPLAGIAALKAVWELVTRPFYWDKTAHGLHDQT